MEYGVGNINPKEAFAGRKGCWEIKYIAGEKGIKEGGGLRIIPPAAGLVLWQIGKVMAFCDNSNVFLEVSTEKTGPLSYHHSNYPAITVKVYGSDLKEGETIRILIGAIGGYVSGRFIQTKAQTHSGESEFNLFVDPVGNANFSREKIRINAYKKVKGMLKVMVKPSREAKIRCTIRNKPAKGKDFIGIISVEDKYENPIIEKGYNISLFVEKGDIKVPLRQIKKAKNKAGVKFVINDSAIKPGRANWFGASCWQNNIYGVSNPVCSNFSKEGYGIYFGDMHVMTEGSCGFGDTEEAIKYARDVFALDFTAITNTGNHSFWSDEQKLFKKYNKDYEFITLPAYETGFLTGHKNIYYLNEDLPVCNSKKISELWPFLADKDCMVISHHPNTHSETDPHEGWGPFDISTINPKYEKLIEICQNRGSFEKDEVGDEVSFGGFGASIRNILAQGYKLGFVGGTDTHRGRPGSPLSNQSGLDAEEHVTGGITGVIAKELSRKSIWEALLARRCYATTSVMMLLDFKLNGHIMGEEVEISDINSSDFAVRKIRIKVAGTYNLDKIVIIRNGREIYQKEVDNIETEMEWIDKEPLKNIVNKTIKGVYYYAKVYQHDKNMAWSSPVWLILNDQGRPYYAKASKGRPGQ